MTLEGETALIAIGPLAAEIETPGSREYRWVRRRCAPFELDGVARTPDVRLAIGTTVRAAGGSDRLHTGRGEVVLHLSGAGQVRVGSEMRLTPRAVARAVKRSLQRNVWRDGRRQLLIRHGFEHPLMALLDGRYGYFPLHAAAVEKSGRACLILGPNGSGKTTLALQLAEYYGFRLIADNFVPCDGRCVLGFPGQPRLKRGAIPEEAPPHRAPVPMVAPVDFLIMLVNRPSTEPLAGDGRYQLLRSYVEREREDHRDTELFRWLVQNGALTRRNSVANDVVRKLAGFPLVRRDWRRDALEDLPVAAW